MSNRNPIVVLLMALVALSFCVTACTQGDDGVLPLSSGDDYFTGKGFFRQAEHPRHVIFSCFTFLSITCLRPSSALISSGEIPASTISTIT